MYPLCFFFFSVRSLLFSAFFFNLGLGDGGCGFRLTEDGVGFGRSEVGFRFGGFGNSGL